MRWWQTIFVPVPQWLPFYLIHVKEELLHSQCRFSACASLELCPALDEDSSFLKGHQTLLWDILGWSWDHPSSSAAQERKLMISARQGAGPAACCALPTVCHGSGTCLQLYLCSLCLEAPQPQHMGHGSSTSIAGSKRRQKRCSSSSVLPKYNPEIFSWCFWLQKVQKLNLQHHQTSAPRGAGNSLSNVISIDLKMRFAFAILCGIWSPLMSRNCSGWLHSPAPHPWTTLSWYCAETQDDFLDEWKMWYVCWLYMQITTLITTDSTGISSGPNSALYLQETDGFFLITDVFYNIPPSTDEKWGK